MSVRKGASGMLNHSLNVLKAFVITFGIMCIRQHNYFAIFQEVSIGNYSDTWEVCN